MNKFSLALAYLILAAGMASGATWFVDAGNTSGVTDGASWETAMTSIQVAIEAAASGDRIIAARGEYRENLYFQGKNLVVQSINPSEPAVVANTIIDGGAEGPVATFQGSETRQCILIGFTLTNGRAPNGGGILGNRCSATIARNAITGNTAVSAVGAAGGAGGGIHGCLGLIQHNLIADNTAEGNGGGLALCPGTIEGNIIRGNTAVYGGGIYNSDGMIQKNRVSGNTAAELGGGLYGCRGVIQNNFIYQNEARFGAGLSTCDANIRNNTIANNRAVQGGGGLAYCSQRTAIVNCIIWGNAPELSAQLLQSAETVYSCVQWLRVLDKGNINERPRFVDWRNGDYRLRDSSPCIDAGKGIPGLVEDFDGEARGYAAVELPVGDDSRFDMGADEFTGVKALLFTRIVPGWKYEPGTPVEITIQLNDFENAGASSNLVLTETLPETWTFAALVSEIRPDNVDVNGTQVRFTWSSGQNMPPLPYSFTYQVNTSPAAGGPQNISGQAQYEVGGEAVLTKVVVNRVLAPEGGALDEAYVDQIELQGETLGWSFEVGLTEEVSSVPVLDLTGFDEGSLPKARANAPVLFKSAKALPAVFDWRDKNGVTPIKYQGVCGSCWAFATNGVVESLVKIQDQQEIDLSEQYLISGNNHPHSNGITYWGCQGGSIAFDYYIDRLSRCNTVGPVLEATLPYTGTDAAPNCPYATTALRLDSWNFVEGRDASVSSIKQAIMEYGPIFTSVYADAAFQSYKGGVYNNDPATDLTNHAVILTGWDDHQGAAGAWIMRNSWSTQWGDAGYMYIEYEVANIGRWSAFGDYGGGSATGSLFVTLEPQAARTQGAQWRVDGGAWQNSGDTAVGLSEGQHTVSFKEVNGYQTPANQIIDITAGEIQDASAAYATAAGETGSLTVTIEPAGARNAGAQWRVDGGAWQNSGNTVSDLATGQHTVSYSAVSGYSSPANATVSIALNATAAATGTYEQNGAVRVTIEPQAARDAGAQWLLDGGTAYASGQTVSGVATGAHAVSFQAVNGWAAPNAQSVEVQAGSVATATGTYVQQTNGALQVNLEPDGARTAGAQWRVNGGAWQNSGASVSLAAGTHAVSFNTITGWSAPANRNVWIDSGVNSISTANYAQTPTGATVTVTIEPAAARTAGAQWRIDGGAWQNSGASITGVSTGAHAVSFSAIAGWQTPGNWGFTISGTETRTFTGTYTANAEGEGEGEGSAEGQPEGQPEGEGEGGPELDSDGDGLTDAEETAIYGTDPHEEDSDGDGWLDGEEVDCASEPMNPNSTCDDGACGCAKRAMHGDFRDYLGDLFLLGLALGSLIAAAGLRRR